MKKVSIITITFALILSLVLTAFPLKNTEKSVPAQTLLDFFDHIDTGEISSEDLQNENYYFMIDENGREITITGRKIHVGDEYITQDNKLYRVYRVQNRIAHARFIREVGVFFNDNNPSFFVSLWNRFSQAVLPVQADDENGEEEEEENLEPEEEPKRLIGIYHTHNAESYVPTDGTDSIYGAGGIHAVGDSFTEALKERGITVIHDETLHLPHDRGAYRRSRVTAENLLEQGPDVIFDVHRDAAPMHVYATEVEGDWVTQVQLVVGRQNPNMQVNRQLALDLKNTSDELHPGLVKGIFMARGDYNQGLTPMNLLLEIGAHQNTREAAEDGVSLFAEVVIAHLYGTDVLEEEPQAAPAPPGNGAAPGQNGGPGMTGEANRTAVRNIGFLLALTIVISVGFLYINAGPIRTIRQKLAPYFEKTKPYTAKSDLFLDSVSEWLRETSLIIGAAIVRFLQAGEQALSPLEGKIYESSRVVAQKTGKALAESDRILAYWQERISDWALTLKERANNLRNRDKLR